MADGQITRKEIIADDAINWGAEYAKVMDGAIAKNKEFVDGIIAINEANKQVRQSSSQKEYVANQKLVNDETRKTLGIWKEQNQLETALISTKRKRQLVNESTNVALQKERLLLAESNKEIKIQAKETLGLVSTYQKLSARRLEAQKTLANLLSAEKLNNTEIRKAQIEFEKLDVRVKAVDATTKNYSRNIGNYQSAFNGLGTSLRGLTAAFGVVTGAALFATTIRDGFNAIRDFDRQLIAVGKTTNMNSEQLKKFGKEIVALGDDLNGISIDGLLLSAEVAGQLGVKGSDNILKFSTAIERLKLTSDIISQEQVQNFAQFISVSKDSFENADKLASVITQLGNNFATTEAQVLGNATEIQKSLSIYEASAQSVLALGAATASLGSEGEVSSTAIQKTFSIINKAIATGEGLQNVLKLTNLTQKELSDQFNKDATGVFVKYIKGLSDAKDAGQNLGLILEENGVKDVRQQKVIGTLASKYDVLVSAIDMANQEYIENQALLAESEAATKSLNSIIGDISDKWNAYILSTNEANGSSQKLAKGLEYIRDNLSSIINNFLKFGTVLLTYIGVMKAANFVTATWGALKTAAAAAELRFALATGIGRTSVIAQAAAVNAATVAQTGLNVAMTATPWGVIIAAIAAVVIAYKVFNEELDKNEKLLIKINKSNVQLKENEEKYNKSGDEYREKRFKAIEDEIKLRKAKGEDSKKLDQEEINRKKEAIETDIIFYNNLKSQELGRTKEEVKQSQLRIEQMQKERDAKSTTGKWKDILDDSIEKEKENLKVKRNLLAKNSEITIQERKRLQALLNELDKNSNLNKADIEREEDEKEKKRKADAYKKFLEARKKYWKEMYEIDKKAKDDAYKLMQQRLQVEIDLNKEILSSNDSAFDDKLEAMESNNNILSQKLKESLEYDLKQLGKYNEDSGKFVRDISDEEIKSLVSTGTTKKQLNDEQLRLYERYQADVTAIASKAVTDRSDLIDQEVTDIKKRNDAQLLSLNTKENQAIEAENKLFQIAIARGDDLVEAERQLQERILAIKRDFAKQGLDLQIKAIEDLLVNQDKLPIEERISAKERAKIENELSELKRRNSEVDTETVIDNGQKVVKSETEKWTERLELAEQASRVLQDLTNAIFENRIQKIDDEINKNNEKYSVLLEAAKNDERQRELLEKERDLRNQELEKKKRKEQAKQALFNKLMAAAQVSIQTALAVITALAAPPGIPFTIPAGILAGSLGAIQLAAVLAAPIPKYASGRKDGKAEIAYTGDGGRREVVERPDGSAYLTPNVATLTMLGKGDKVYSSEEAYKQRLRNSILQGFRNDNQKVAEFHNNTATDKYGAESLSVMKDTLKAIRNQKFPMQKSEKIDINHHLWKMGNTNWK